MNAIFAGVANTALGDQFRNEARRRHIEREIGGGTNLRQRFETPARVHCDQREHRT